MRVSKKAAEVLARLTSVHVSVRRLAGLVAAIVLTVGPSAHAAANHGFTPNRALGKQALAQVKQIQRGHGVRTGHELTPVLAQLYANLPALSGSDRREAEAMLARPDDTQADPSGTHKWSPSAHVGTPYVTAHFKVHFVTTGSDAAAHPAAHAKEIGDLLENQVYPCENGTAAASCAGQPGLGWRDAAPDAGLGGDDRVDVYIEDLYTNEHVYGYVAIDPGQSESPSVPHYAYMVMDSDYTRFGDGSAASGLAAEQVTAAHEYNHVLQNAYDYLEDPWMFEATAVYMEDKVFPAVNDYVKYVSAFAANPREPLTSFSSSSLHAYGAAVWNHWLDHQYGAAVVRSAWEQSIPGADFAPGAYGLAIAALGGGGFSDEFDRFASEVPEWDVPGVFPDTYPDVSRDGTLAVETQTLPFALPHATFSLLDVPIPANAPPTIRLTANLPQGTAGAVALVGRTGTDPGGGSVTRSLTQMPSGGTAVASLDNPAQFGRITAVVANSDPSHAGFDPVADDWIFTKDASAVTLSLQAPGPPIPTTGAAGLIGDHGALLGGSVDPHLLDTNWQVEYGRTASYGKITKAQLLPASTIGAAPVSVPVGGLDAKALYHFRVTATNSAGVASGPDMTFMTAADVTKPTVTVKVKRQRLARVRKAGLVYLARCSERCQGTAELLVSRRVARRLRLPRVLAKTRVTLNVRSRSTLMRLRLRRAARLTPNSAPFAAVLRFSVADAARNRVTKERRVRLL
jgi:hypothetical protein